VLGGVIRFGWQFFESFLETSLSMAVAVVPEGLPAVVTGHWQLEPKEW